MSAGTEVEEGRRPVSRPRNGHAPRDPQDVDADPESVARTILLDQNVVLSKNLSVFF